MRYISDDGKVQGTEDEVRAYEESQKFDGEIAQQVGEYLDSIELADKDGNKRNLNGREFSRRETVIKDWIRWDREQRPDRYEEIPNARAKESDEPAVNVVTGAA